VVAVRKACSQMGYNPMAKGASVFLYNSKQAGLKWNVISISVLNEYYVFSLNPKTWAPKQYPIDMVH